MPASSVDDTGEEKEVVPQPATCWERFIAEQNPCQDWFLKQHPANDRPIDIAGSFAPEGCQPLFFKVTCGGFVIATAIWSFIDYGDDRVFWLAYATNWVELLGSLYMCLSIFMTLFGAQQPYKRVSSNFLKFTWLLFTFVSHFSILNAIFWWLYVYEKGVTTLDWLHLVPHSVMPFTITFDGLNVNRIPLRWQHYWGFVVPMEFCYVLWTYLQNEVFEVENPDLLNLTNDTELTVMNITDGTNTTELISIPINITNHYIYEAYNWKEEGADPMIMSVIGILAFGPPIFFVEWMFSQYWVMCLCLGDRRLYYTDPRANRPKRGKLQGAGLAGMSSVRRMSFDEDEDSYSSSEYDSRDEETKEEERVEDEPMDGEQPTKKFRSKLEELAYRS